MLELLNTWLIAPFDYGFMRRAVVGGLALSHCGPATWACFLVLTRHESDWRCNGACHYAGGGNRLFTRRVLSTHYQY